MRVTETCGGVCGKPEQVRKHGVEDAVCRAFVVSEKGVWRGDELDAVGWSEVLADGGNEVACVVCDMVSGDERRCMWV